MVAYFMPYHEYARPFAFLCRMWKLIYMAAESENEAPRTVGTITRLHGGHLPNGGHLQAPPPPNIFQRSACRFQTPVFWNQRIDFPIIVYRMPGRYAGVSCGRFIRAPSKISGSLFPSYPVRNQSFNPAEITRRAQVGSNRLVCGSQTTVLPTVPPCESVNPSVLLNHRVTAV